MDEPRRCNNCHSKRLIRQARNTRPFAEVLYTCRECGHSTRVQTVHNPYRPEERPFENAPQVGADYE